MPAKERVFWRVAHIETENAFSNSHVEEKNVPFPERSIQHWRVSSETHTDHMHTHKIHKKIGRHNYYLLWKTTKKNTPGKTYHGKFYKSKEEAMKFKKKQSRKKTGNEPNLCETIQTKRLLILFEIKC